MAIQAHLVELERKHKILENELHEALVHLSTDDLQIVELKRRKLMVKDEIERLKHIPPAKLCTNQFPARLSASRQFTAGWALMRSSGVTACCYVPSAASLHASANPPTWSAIASDDVSPGNSMPNRLISPATP